MKKHDQDVFARALARLTALRNNIDKITSGVEEKYVFEYHSILDTLETINEDMTDFKIPASYIKPHWAGSGPGYQRYTNSKYVEKAFILSKLDAVLAYFQFITSPEPKKVGFQPPEK